MSNYSRLRPPDEIWLVVGLHYGDVVRYLRKTYTIHKYADKYMKGTLRHKDYPLIKFQICTDERDIRGRFFDDIIIIDDISPDFEDRLNHMLYMIKLRKGYKSYEILHGHWLSEDTDYGSDNNGEPSFASRYERVYSTFGTR